MTAPSFRWHKDEDEEDDARPSKDSIKSLRLLMKIGAYLVKKKKKICEDVLMNFIYKVKRKWCSKLLTMS